MRPTANRATGSVAESGGVDDAPTGAGLGRGAESQSGPRRSSASPEKAVHAAAAGRGGPARGGNGSVERGEGEEGVRRARKGAGGQWWRTERASWARALASLRDGGTDELHRRGGGIEAAARRRGVEAASTSPIRRRAKQSGGPVSRSHRPRLPGRGGGARARWTRKSCIDAREVGASVARRRARSERPVSSHRGGGEDVAIVGREGSLRRRMWTLVRCTLWRQRGGAEEELDLGGAAG